MKKYIHPVGFEPTPPKRIELESIALDRSATNAYDMNIQKYFNAGSGIRTHASEENRT